MRAGGEIANATQNGSGTAARWGMLSYKPVGALISGIAVLRYVAAARAPLPLAQITRDLKLNPSTCLNILRTLTQEGYLIVDPHSRLYSMGLGVLDLVGGALAQGGDFRAIRAMTDAIAMNEHVTVTLWRRVKRDRKILVLESLPVGELSIKMAVGQRLPLLVGAAGYLWAAYTSLSHEELAEQFRDIRLERRPTFSEFIEEAGRVKERGWALDDGYYTSGATSISVPVLDEKNEPIFAFTATMFSQQFRPERAEALARELKRPADLLSTALCYL